MKRPTSTAFIDDERVHPDVLWTSKKIQEELNGKSSIDHRHKVIEPSQVPLEGVRQWEGDLRIHVDQIDGLRFPPTPWGEIRRFVAGMIETALKTVAPRDHHHEVRPHTHSRGEIPEYEVTEGDVKKYEGALEVRYNQITGIPAMVSPEIHDRDFLLAREAIRDLVLEIRKLAGRVRDLEGRLEVAEKTRFRQR